MVDYLMASTPLCAVNNEPRAGHSQLGPTSRAALCAGIWSAVNANADMENSPAFFEANLGNTDPLAIALRRISRSAELARDKGAHHEGGGAYSTGASS